MRAARDGGKETGRLLRFKSAEMAAFYRYEGKLATYPIYSFIDKHGAALKGRLVDVGCGSKPYKEYFGQITEYIGVDLENNAAADVHADAKALPFSENFADAVLCAQVLEHDCEPERIIKEIHRILKEGGYLLLSAPQMGRLHGEPNDFYRFTKYGLKYMLEKNGFTLMTLESHGGFFRAFGSHLNFFLVEYFGKRRFVKKMLRCFPVSCNNFVFGVADKLVRWDKDTLGHNVLAMKGSQ